jgi:hypothetical protein
MINKRLNFALFMSFFIYTHCFSKVPKIVGLIAVHNEAELIKQCLKALAVYTDAIVVLDDVSADDSVEVIESVVQECKIEKIIQKEIWVRDEKGDKNLLLKAGREIGGTHFIMLDADEMFVAQCAKKDWLRNQVLALKPGQALCFPMMNVWDNLDSYRDDEAMNPRMKKWSSFCAAFCDDGQCNYDSNQVYGPAGIIHVSRVPMNRMSQEPKNIVVPDLKHGIVHFKYVNLEDIRIKKVWYMCLEYVNANRASNSENERIINADKINKFYNKIYQNVAPENIEIKLTAVPEEWYAYPFFDRSAYEHLHKYRKKEIKKWFKKFGASYFEPLDIWHLNWIKKLS